MRTKTLTIIFLLFSIAGVSVESQGQSTASFGGIVITDTGQPVSGTKVTYQNLGDCTRTPSGGLICGGPTIDSSVITDSNGNFLVTGLPAGQFTLCAWAKEPNQINSCAWSNGNTTVQLQSGESKKNTTLVLQTGTVIRVHIYDRDHAMENGYGLTEISLYGNDGHIIGGSSGIQQQGPPNYLYTIAIPKTAQCNLELNTGWPIVVLNEAGESIPSSGIVRSITVNGDTGLDLNLTVTAPFVNAANFLPNINRGGIASLFDTGITNINGIVTATTLPLPTELAGTSLTVFGRPAPIFSVSNVNGQQQINFQFPTTQPDQSGMVIVNNNGVKKIYYPVFGIAPPFIFVNNGQPAIQHSDNSQPVTKENPAKPGEVVTIWVMGLDCASPPLQDGVPAPESPPRLCTTPKITVDGQPAVVLFAGLAPGLVGIDQLNVQLPQSLQPGISTLALSGAGNTVQLPVQ